MGVYGVLPEAILSDAAGSKCSRTMSQPTSPRTTCSGRMWLGTSGIRVVVAGLHGQSVDTDPNMRQTRDNAC